MGLKRCLAAAACALAFATGAQAIPVTWTADYTYSPADTAITATFNVLGSFVWDADTGVASAIDLRATDSLGISNTTYTVLLSETASGSDTVMQFGEVPAIGDLTGSLRLSLRAPELTNAGGVVTNETTPGAFFFVASECTNSTCLSQIGIGSWSVTGSPLLTNDSRLVGVPAVPLPAGLPMLFMALGGLAWLRAKRKALSPNPNRRSARCTA